jgi:RNA polymerase-binding transcription factor DksA
MPEIDRQKVEERLAQREREIEERRKAMQSAGDPSAEELADYDNHPGDQGSETLIKEMDETTEVILEEDARRIREARQRLEEGKYGICVDCGKEIPADRLEAMPETIRCVEDQRIFEARMKQAGGPSANY